MASTTIQKVERLRTQLANAREEIRAGAKIGVDSVLTVSGGIVAGWFYAKHPTIAGTSFPSAAAAGAGLVLGAMAGLFDDYSEPLAALGSGLLAVVVGKESESYFRK